MIEILKKDMSDYCLTGEFEVAGSISADKESKSEKLSKTVHLVFILDKTPLGEVMAPALANKKITWATGKREKFDQIVDGATIKVNFKGGTVPVSPEEAMVSKLQRMTPEEQSKYLAELMNKVKK